jgi:hypothetical protein
VVAARVDPAVEAEWNRWYDEVHLPDIAGCPGFRRGSRYVAATENGPAYLAVYELDGPAALHSPEFASRRGWGPFAPHVEATVTSYRRISLVEGNDG